MTKTNTGKDGKVLGGVCETHTDQKLNWLGECRKCYLARKEPRND